MNNWLIALAGNQNSGKTTLFNALTGSNQHVGNFPGVTVEKKEGKLLGQEGTLIVDLPGVYSLTPYTSEEQVTRDFLVDGRPDVIINIVDATALERNLYLTIQLLELGIPLVLAFNMMDEVRANGYIVDIDAIGRELGVRALAISASNEQGIKELAQEALVVAEEQLRPRSDFYTEAVGDAVIRAIKIVENRAVVSGLSPLFAASHMLVKDEYTAQRLKLSNSESDELEHIAKDMERVSGADREAAIADARYQFIDLLCKKLVKKGKSGSREQRRSVKIDEVLTHPVFGLPIFFGVMLLVFALTFGSIGQWLSVMANLAISSATGAADALLAALDTAPLLRSLIIDGVFAGVGGVLSFMPTILVLFFLLSVLEDTGYMTRVAFLMDSLLRKIGLSGRSVVPLLIGFGCSVPAIMASRTLPGERDRKLTVLLVPFMSCSAKLPIYALVTDALFVRYKPLVLMSIYLLGMIIGVIYGLIFKNTVFKSEPAPFVLELPAYRLPTLRGVWLTIKRRAEDFLKKAFTVIFLATIIVWFLQRFDFSLAYVTDSSQSILASLGRAIAPALRPLGFGDWRIATALLTGITAKEAVVSTLGVLLASSGGETLTQALRAILTPLSAYSLLAFILLYMPCVAAMAAIRRELDSSLSALLAMLCQTALAWLVACLIYQGGLLFGLV